ncbi:MAG: hypothetical protein IPQ07_42300 [Myxococcales bacterium]|nr:hypothetical protein [Myxococcales bacterium]
MARLGELLVAAGLLTVEQLDQALRAQVLWGARVGTNLIELGFLDLDQLSSALGQQHSLPAALARHFEKVDKELQLLLSADVAQKLSVVPLVRVGPERKIVIAASGPLSPKALAIVADELCVEPDLLIPAVAAELRIRYQLEKVYGIPRTSRFMRSPGPSRQSFHSIEIEDPESDPEIPLESTAERALTHPHLSRDPIEDLAIDIDLGYTGAEPPAEEAPEEAVEQLDDDDVLLEPTIERATTQAEDHPAGALANLDDLPPSDAGDELAVPTPVEEDNSSGRERRRYVRTIADGPEEPPAVPIPVAEPPGSGPIPTKAALGRIAIRRVALTPGGGTSASEGKTLGEATRAIRRGVDRDKVAALIIDALFRFMPPCRAASLLVVRGGIATSWRGFCRSGAPEAEISVPLDQPGLVPRASHRNTTVRAALGDLGPLDQLLMASLGAEGELAVVPISIAGQVMCVIAMVTETDTPSGTAESIAAAAGAAFARLMRDASR